MNEVHDLTQTPPSDGRSRTSHRSRGTPGRSNDASGRPRRRDAGFLLLGAVVGLLSLWT